MRTTPQGDPQQMAYFVYSIHANVAEIVLDKQVGC
jgi:hypothetical protein